jgi:hypothetical protein
VKYKFVVFLIILPFYFNCSVNGIFNRLHTDNNPISDTTDDPIPSSQYTVSDALGSKLELADSIRLQWTSKADVSFYYVYRYGSKDLTDPLNVPDIFQVTPADPSQVQQMIYMDNSVVIDKPYFYQVFSFFNNQLYGDLNDFSFGTCSDVTDDYESNDDFTLFEGSGTLTFPTLNQRKSALFYAYQDGLNNTISDVDYYKYRGPMSATIYFKVRLSDTTEYNSGDLKFRYYYNGSFGPEQNVLTGQDSTLDFYVAQPGDIDVFFQVYLDSSVSIPVDRVETYDVEITDVF